MSNRFAKFVNPLGQMAVIMLMAMVIFTVTRSLFPNVLASMIGPAQLLTIGPSPMVMSGAVEGQQVAAEFVVKNVSREPVDILGARSTCSCTLVTSEFPFTLKPGESRKLKMNVTVGNPDNSGQFVTSSTLFANREGMVPSITSKFVSVQPSRSTGADGQK